MPYETLAEDFVPSTARAPGRRVWTSHPAFRAPKWVVIFLDAELYIERVTALAVIQRLHDSGLIAPTLAVFVSHGGAPARHEDFTCNSDYANFVSQDVTEWVFARHTQLERGRVVLAGLSLSGLAAAHASLMYPNVFGAAICQSPSFWWSDERFRSSLPQATGSRPSYWISVGNQETTQGISHPPSGMFQQTTQIDACQRTCDALRSSGFNVRYRVFDGGHDANCWRDDLALALSWAASIL